MKRLKLTFQGQEIGSVEISDQGLEDIVSAAAVIERPPTASLDIKSIESCHLATVLDISFPGHTFEKF